MFLWFKNKVVNVQEIWEACEAGYYLRDCDYMALITSDEDEYWTVTFVDRENNYIISASANETIGGIVELIFNKKSCILEKLDKLTSKK